MWDSFVDFLKELVLPFRWAFYFLFSQNNPELSKWPPIDSFRGTVLRLAIIYGSIIPAGGLYVMFINGRGIDVSAILVLVIIIRITLRNNDVARACLTLLLTYCLVGVSIGVASFNSIPQSMENLNFSIENSFATVFVRQYEQSSNERELRRIEDVLWRRCCSAEVSRNYRKTDEAEILGYITPESAAEIRSKIRKAEEEMRKRVRANAIEIYLKKQQDH